MKSAAGLQMPMAPVPSVEAPIPAGNDTGWRDELWALFMGVLDGALRSYYDIVEFTDDPTCVFRVGRVEAERAVRLSDGIHIRAGETIGTLHFWNEQLPPFPRSGGPRLCWAVDMQRRVARSLGMLAQFVESDPRWRDVRAFRGEAALSSRIGETQLRRVAHRYGFERIAAPPSVLRQLHQLGECFSAWGLTRAYNCAALPRQRFFRRYQEVWISRATLIARHAGNPERAGRAGRTCGDIGRWPR
ncbi:MAG TPA: hypothetical protein VHW66_00315 [Stellaceae bacterium]|jgi:hypothetical protein|nr:hypothetical protein [Stellaceae bacterium]